jgi:hypothetical protein
MKLCLITLLLLLSGCAVGRAPVRAYHALYCQKMNADGVHCQFWATPCGRLNCGGK